MATLHYIHDPLCGWCYGAAPLVKAARQEFGSAYFEDLLYDSEAMLDSEPPTTAVLAAMRSRGGAWTSSRAAAPDWRPFAKPLEPVSQRQAMSILDSLLFNWLVEAGYLAGNPLALRRRPRTGRAPA